MAAGELAANTLRSPHPIKPAAPDPPRSSLYLLLGHTLPGVSPSVSSSLLPNECKGLRQIAVACGRALPRMAQWVEVGGVDLLPRGGWQFYPASSLPVG